MLDEEGTTMHTIRLGALIAALVVPLRRLRADGPGESRGRRLPGLLAVAQPRLAELRAAGVKQIVGRTTGRNNVQVLHNWGAAYLRWPKGVTPVAFELYVNADGTNAAFANGFSEATKAQYATALDALVPQAIKAAENARYAATRPKP
jgi:hypothetical protein